MLTGYLNRWGFLPFLLLVFLAAQVPFLRADPHANIAYTSRDAFTDEGLNTSQVINRVNHGTWVVDECDNLIKTPLFSLWLFPAYTFFGTADYVGRMWVLLGCLVLWFSFSRRHERLPAVMGVFVLLGLTQYHLFQYSRFTMAEMTASSLVLSGLGYAFRYGESRHRADWVWAGLFLWAAVFTKNQFAYTLVLLPVWALLIQWINGTFWSRQTLRLTGCSLLMLAGGGLLYYWVWYLPVKNTYDYVMAHQTEGRFIPFSQLSTQGVWQVKQFFVSSYTRVFAWFGLLCLPVWGMNFFISKNKAYRLLSLLALSWALLELYKFTMWYVPSRYLVSLLFAWGIFAAVQVVWAVKNALDYGRTARLTGGLVLMAALFLFAANLYYGIGMYRERRFVIHETNQMLARVNFGNRPVVGPWAPTLARETGARILPVWYRYFNDNDLLRVQNPKVIISEWDEQDSDGAYQKHGIRLEELADSVQEVQVARFRLRIYYLP